MKNLTEIKELLAKKREGVKVKMSLKKKLIIGGAVVVTAIVGALAYGKKKQNDSENAIEDLDVDYDENDEEFVSDTEEEVILEDEQI